MTSNSNASIANPFTQSWIQALTLSADNPVARRIKPRLDLIDRVSMTRAGTERVEAAQELWDFAVEFGLTGVLAIVPLREAHWAFADEDRFLFQLSKPLELESLSHWCQCLGIEPGKFELTAEVTNSDWTTLVRSEAVRLQKPFNSTATGSENILHPKCHAEFDGAGWSIRFAEVDWLELRYEETAQVPRPPISEIEEVLSWAISEADRSLVSTHASKCAFVGAAPPWLDCVRRLEPLHKKVLDSNSGYSSWLQRSWSCVWPVVYREQNALQGKADLDTVRTELKACLTAVPKLTAWMFVFAKLVCQTQTGMGLGIAADYVD